MQKRALISFLLALMISVSYASAQEVTTFTDSAGITPDSPLYTFDVFFDFFQSAESRTEEHLGEMELMIEAGDYESASKAITELEDALSDVESSVDGVHDIGTIVEEQKAILLYDNVIENTKAEILSHVESGQITEEQAAELGIDTTLEHVISIESDISVQKEEIIETTAAETGKTELEVVIEDVEPIEDSSGLTTLLQEEISEELPATITALQEIEAELATTEVTSVDKDSLETIVENTKLELQQAENANDYELYSDAFHDLTDAQYLTLKCDEFLKTNPEELTEEERTQLESELENIVVSPDELRTDIDEENQDFLQDYEIIREEFLIQHPDKADQYEKLYDQAQKAIELGNTLRDSYQVKFDSLIAEGKTQEEATNILMESFSMEYRNVYGEPFVPPGFINFEEISQEELDKHGYGGFIEDYTYRDPVTGYQYEFKSDGHRYTYITPSGLVFEERYPEGFDPKQGYVRGNEEFQYNIGDSEYIYTATGYEIIKPDGTKETFPYPEGKYEVFGGGQFEYDATGFKYHREGREDPIAWEYNPTFDTYASSDYKNQYYTPPEGTYIHEDYKYDEATNSYTYTHGSEEWTYNPGANTWTSSTGETHSGSTSVVAPVGHEDTGSYTTTTGETWTYDESSGSWTSSSGSSYTSSGSYTDAQGNTYTSSYDPNTGSYSYTDPHTGETYSGYSGGYSGGTTGGYTGGEGSYSGGDSGSYSGGGGDSGGGGHSGGGGEGTGHAVKEVIKRTISGGKLLTTYAIKIFRIF